MSSRQRSACGFTLIELLVVIAIVGILLALLLPALSKSKELGKRTQCLSNHRQLNVGWHGYIGDHEDSLPPCWDGVDCQPGMSNWVAGNMWNPNEATNAPLLVDPKVSLLGPYVGDPRLYKCPSDPSPLVRSVSMNNHCNPFNTRNAISPWTAGDFLLYRKLSDFRDPSRIFVILDERPDCVNDGNFAVDMSNTGHYLGAGTVFPYYWVDRPGTYHNQGVVLSFADGHADWHKWVEATTLGPLGLVGPTHTSARDRDAQWVQEHCAEPK